MLCITDFEYIEIAENLYLSSLKRYNIQNYITCSNKKAEEYLIDKDIHAMTLWNESTLIHGKANSHENYFIKTNLKTRAVYIALCLGYTTLLVDIDIVFLKNPLPYVLNLSKEYDLITQYEYHEINTGRIIFRFACYCQVLCLYF